MARRYCESCMMPLDKDPGVRESDKYCSLCFKNGELMYKGNDLKEFQRIVYDSMRSRGGESLVRLVRYVHDPLRAALEESIV